MPIKASTKEAELKRFAKMRADMLGNAFLNKEMWSHVVVTPDDAEALFKALPDMSPSGMPVRAAAEAAYNHVDTHWVEKLSKKAMLAQL